LVFFHFRMFRETIMLRHVCLLDALLLLFATTLLALLRRSFVSKPFFSFLQFFHSCHVVCSTSSLLPTFFNLVFVVRLASLLAYAGVFQVWGNWGYWRSTVWLLFIARDECCVSAQVCVFEVAVWVWSWWVDEETEYVCRKMPLRIRRMYVIILTVCNCE